MRARFSGVHRPPRQTLPQVLLQDVLYKEKLWILGEKGHRFYLTGRPCPGMGGGSRTEGAARCFCPRRCRPECRKAPRYTL